MFNSANRAMNKAREALMLSENKKIIEDEVRHRKEHEAIELLEAQQRREQQDRDREER